MKKPKDEVDYSHGHKDSHCGQVSKDDTGHCRNFRPSGRAMNDYSRAGTCTKVIGPIKRIYWCNLWEKHD